MTTRQRSFDDNTHLYGRIWGIALVVVLIGFPFLLALAFGVKPDWHGIGANTAGMLVMYLAVCTIEFITYVPLLGSAGSYLSFVTGNLTALKVPCALNAMNNAGVSSNSEEGELISTIAIAVSSIVTVLILAIGVLLISVSGFSKVLENPTLKPAFDNILPALFGGLGVVFISRDWKTAVVPVVLAVVLFIAVPSLGGVGAVLVPVFGIISILAARIMYKKGWLGGNEKVAQQATAAMQAELNQTEMSEGQEDNNAE